MKDFFENTIVISWIAPIITGLIVIIITTGCKVILIWWKNRALIRNVNGANEKYINNILPYMIQEIDLGEGVLYSIKNAISLEYQVAMKYMYTNEQIRNQIILKISNTRFMTENDKAKLINNVMEIFNNIGNSIEEKTITKKKRRIDKKYPTISMIAGLIFMVIICVTNTDKIDDPTSVVQVLVAVDLIIIIISMLILWELILDDMTTSIKVDIADDGIVGIMNQVVQAFGNAVHNIFFGEKKRTEDDELNESRNNHDKLNK